MKQAEVKTQNPSLEDTIVLSFQTLKIEGKLNLNIGLQGPYQNKRGESFFLVDFYGEKDADGKVGPSLGTIHTLKYVLEQNLKGFREESGISKYHITYPGMKVREDGAQNSPSDSFLLGNRDPKAKPVWVIDIHQLYDQKNPPGFLDLFRFPDAQGAERSFKIRPGYGNPA